MMAKTRMTISVAEEVASYLKTKPNASAVVAAAIKVYRKLELERELAAAYREDAAEAEQINREWQPGDAELPE
jgi:hypothetical protein